VLTKLSPLNFDGSDVPLLLGADGGKENRYKRKACSNVRESMVAPMSDAIKYCAIKLAGRNEKEWRTNPNMSHECRVGTNQALWIV